MKRSYPYLFDSYYEDANGAKQKRNFLQQLDNIINQKQYVRITLLNWQEEPLKEIEGELSSGSIQKDGSSPIRRTCSFSATVDSGKYDIDNANMDFAINKKIYIEIGIKNYTHQYPDYPILWFPQGTFFIGDFSMSSAANSQVQLSFSLKDKMAGLNGDVGGIFTATVQLDEVDTQTPSGEYVVQKILVYDIIKELVNHWGGEDLNNIVIEDVPTRVKQVMKWNGSTPLYLVPKGSSLNARDAWYDVTLEKPISGDYLEKTNGIDAGYIFADFIYADELVAAPGETVCSVLDKIKDYLGNYEYFYDEYGIFHFREIRDYLNTTQATVVVNDMNANNYLIDIAEEKSSYTFSDDSNLISISVQPNYTNIKNDYMILGLRKGDASDISFPIMYHLAIDKKPITGNVYRDLLIYEEDGTSLIKAAFPIGVDSEQNLPLPGNFNVIYRIAPRTDYAAPQLEESFFYWDDNVYKPIKALAYYPQQGIIGAKGYTVQDWRTELYLQGQANLRLGLDNNNLVFGETTIQHPQSLGDLSSLGELFRQQNTMRRDANYYFEELDAFWPQVYNLHEQRFYGEEEDEHLQVASLCDGNYYLDFIDPSTSGLGEYAISNIGRRSDVINDDSINCLFEPEIPDIVFLNIDAEDSEELITLRTECMKKNQPWTQVEGDIFNSFANGGYKNSAFVQLQYELYLHTSYQKQLSITALPAFYLEPNTRVHINDKSTQTYGDYLITSVSLTLGAGNAMSCSASECVSKM